MEFRPLNLDIADKVGVRKHEALHYLKLGDSYSEISYFQEAIDSYGQYLRICKEQQDRTGEGNAYGRLGSVYVGVGKFIIAKQYFEQQLIIAKAVYDRKEEGRALSSLGSAFLHLENFPKAQEMFNYHLTISRELKDRSGEGNAYGNLGILYYMLDDCKQAMDYSSKYLTIVMELGDRVGEGKAYGNLGRVHRRIGDFKGAIEYHKKQLSIAVEKGNQADEACVHYLIGCNLESLEAVKEALECYRSSAKLLNDIRFRLRSRENSAFKDEWKINVFHEIKHVYKALCRILLKLKFVLEALFVAEQGRAQALADVMAFRYGIKTVQLLSAGQEEWVSDIHRYISTNTVFFEIDTDTIYIWVLVPGQHVQLRSFPINYKTTGRRDATEYPVPFIDRVYLLDDLIQWPSRTFQKLAFDDRNSDHYRILYDTFFGSIVDLFQGDELVIIPCGPLYMAPFAAFLDPHSKYLCESFRIRVAPSLTSLKLIADCPQGYHRESGALIVGDPCCQKITSRFRRARQLKLPFAREEAEMIAKLINTDALVGEKATKMAVLERLNSVALVHIAAFNDAKNGEITLAPNPTTSFRMQREEDYLLTMADVFNVKVRAKLVVLSCCHTARGEIKAEGVVGIARTFLAAGARSVLVSLWAIEDRATFEFMKSFYHHLVKGDKASEALNKAMKCLRESEDFSDVRYWAPFVLIGDDVTLRLPFAGIV